MNIDTANPTTAAEHVLASYQARMNLLGWHLPEDKNEHFRSAAVAVASYLGRPLTADEIAEAAALTATFNKGA